MIRFLLHLFFLVILISIQVSFIHALPYPFDRVPLVIVLTVFLYQYGNWTSIWWWPISYGLVLDILTISIAPLEVISYTFATFIMMLLVAQVFTNRSFYGMAATSLLSLFVLLLSQIIFIWAAHIFSLAAFFWRDVIFSQAWAMGFSTFLLIFIFPSFRRVSRFAQNLIVE